MAFLAELQRRNVIRVAGLYLVGAWLVVQVASTLLPVFDAPAWALRAAVTLLAVGFVPALLLSWVFELTPDGLKRESEIDRSQSIAQSTAQRIEHAIVVVLALALMLFAFDKFVLAPREKAAQQQAVAVQVAEARKQGGAEALVSSYGDKSIAVLPFVNMSSDKEQEYFADGISEELLNQLAKVHGLRVIARTSSFSFKGKDADVATIAEALQVAHVLEGSVRRSGNKLRISAKLIRTADSGELWSETYDREMADIFVVQDEISAAVVAQLRLKLLGGSPTASTVDPEAYALFLRARTLRYVRSQEAVQESVVLLKRALAIEPEFAEAWAMLGSSYRQLADGGLLSNAEGYDLARRAVSRAFALEPELATAHAELATLALGEPDLAAAAMHLSRAAASAPEDIAVLRATSTLADYLGRHAEAIAYARAFVARDPSNPSAHALLGTVLLNAGMFDDSIASLRETLRQSPGYVTANVGLGDALIAKGDPQAALVAMQQESGPWRLMGEAVVYHALERKSDSDAALAELTRAWPKDAAYNIAYIHAYRGETDLAFEWLEKAAQNKDPGLAEVGVQRYLSSLHKDPRWLPYLRKLGMAPEQLATIKLDVPVPSPAAVGTTASLSR